MRSLSQLNDTLKRLPGRYRKERVVGVVSRRCERQQLTLRRGSLVRVLESSLSVSYSAPALLQVPADVQLEGALRRDRAAAPPLILLVDLDLRSNAVKWGNDSLRSS